MAAPKGAPSPVWHTCEACHGTGRVLRRPSGVIGRGADRLRTPHPCEGCDGRGGYLVDANWQGGSSGSV